MNYLTAFNIKRWWIESRFLHTCWTEDSPTKWDDFRPFYYDSLLEWTRELKYFPTHWGDGTRSDEADIGAVFDRRIFLLATMIIGESQLPAHTNLLETTTRSSLNMLQWSKMESTAE